MVAYRHFKTGGGAGAMYLPVEAAVRTTVMFVVARTTVLCVVVRTTVLFAVVRTAVVVSWWFYCSY